jgi:hypothetical protein
MRFSGANGRAPFNRGQDAWRLRRRNRDRGEGKPWRHRLPGGLYGALRDAIYVLHAFQKKSKKGIATPTAEIDLINV